MEITALKRMLDTLQLPIAYDHFHNKINPPFITYRELPIDSFNADDKNYMCFDTYEIELCTIKKDINLENQIEVLFFNNNIPFEKDENWDEQEKMYHIIYTI